MVSSIMLFLNALTGFDRMIEMLDFKDPKLATKNQLQIFALSWCQTSEGAPPQNNSRKYFTVRGLV